MASRPVVVLLLLVMASVVLAAGPARAPSALVPVDVAGSMAVQPGPIENPMQAPRPGEYAPDFELPTVDGKQVLRLSSHRGARPVVLVFGSYT